MLRHIVSGEMSMKMMTVNQVKQYNIEMIKNALQSIPSGTKMDVARITGLSVATCNTILNELAQTNEILEVKSDAPAIGRPPKNYCFNENYSYICCLFLVKNTHSFGSLHYVVADLRGNFIAEGQEDQPEVTFDTIVECISRLKAQYNHISKISLGVPGYYHKHRLRSGGRPVLDGRDVVKELHDLFDCDIYVENDVNATAYGLYYFRNDIVRRDENIVLVTMMKENSLGAGTIIDGKILRGHSYFAGELLHMNYAGGTAKELLRSGRDGVIAVAVHLAINISAIINPSVIVFTGNNISTQEIEEIQAGVLRYISEDNLPRLIYKSHFERYYLQGLTAIALDESTQSLSAKYCI